MNTGIPRCFRSAILLSCRNFPDEGQGSDFSGTVVEVGEGVNDGQAGDAVIGMSDERSAQAEYVTIAQDRLVPLPEGLDPAVAACLYVAGTTAWAAVGAVAPQSGETVVVSAAAGGVGLLAAQLARRAGADVIGIAGPSSAQVLRDIGVRPVEYGDGLVERFDGLWSRGSPSSSPPGRSSCPSAPSTR